LRRLNELGILSRPEFRTVASVSGGSITAAALATAFARISPPASGPIPEAVWNAELRDPLRSFTRRNVRTGPLVRRLLPWNWLRGSTAVLALARAYERRLTPLPLAALPLRPAFLICATDMAFGVNWIFSRDRVGDYQAGYGTPPSDHPLARAVAASSCFPPLFGPLPAGVTPGELTGGAFPAGPRRDSIIAGMRLTDGGAYDNMGLEPVWKDHATVLVSDAGGLFTEQGDRGILWRIPRYQGIQERQTRALRKRWLISSFATEVLRGAYWGIGSAAARYGRPGGYSKDLARDVIAQIRTDLDAFSGAEAAVLENHGYFLVEAALRAHLPELVPPGALPLRPPHPEWLDEASVRAALAQSGRRTLLGRF
jgi:NTE family protein